MKKRLKHLRAMVYVAVGMIMCNPLIVSADVTFNQAKAKSDIKELLDPISNFLLFIALPVTACTIGYAYLQWNGKDEQEKESMPFHKVVMKHIIAFILVGLTGSMLKWFSIS